MEIGPEGDERFDIKPLDGIPFYPVIGNHEVESFGIFGGANERARREARFRKRFIDGLPIAATHKLGATATYSVDLEGGVHFIALDNVTLKRLGQEQIDWLGRDLEEAKRNNVKYIIVGMHKAFVNHCTTHSMQENSDGGPEDSEQALKLLTLSGLTTYIFASHEHGYVEFVQLPEHDDKTGFLTYITGGLGAPTEGRGDVFFPHVLQLDVDELGPNVGVIELKDKLEKPTCKPCMTIGDLFWGL